MRVFSKSYSKSSLLLVVAAVVALIGVLVNCMNVSWAATPDKHKVLIGKSTKMTTNEPVVVMETNKGTIKIEVFKSEAPITSNNFLDLVQRKFYDGLSFHRVEPGFVVQGGDPKGNGTGGFIDPATHKERTIALETKPNLKHNAAGIVAMARSNDPNSASSQFYITLGPASFLDGGYAVFGKVIEGIDVVKQLKVGDKMTKVSMLETANK
jgi:cyclophilin family peptidyl-prolyl cis-trans isomerase